MIPNYYNRLPPEDHMRDWNDCQMWGCAPPDSLGLCPDCGEAAPKEHGGDDELS